MLLQDLVKNLEYTCLKGQLTGDVSKVEHHSGRIEKGTLFVAISGFKMDGHDYIQRVIEAGAIAVVVEKTVDLQAISENICVLSVKDTRVALAVLANNFYDQPTKAITLTGVTGTNGKTSITQILNNMHQALALKTAVFGTIANNIDGEVIPTENTTPDALTLATLMNRAKEKGVSHCFMEVSSHALKLNRVHSMHFDFAVFTNLTEDHLDFHPDFEDYYSSKNRLFEMAEKTCIINNDNDYGKRIIESLKGRKDIITYGLDCSSDLWADEIIYSQSSTSFTLRYNALTLPVTLRIPGKIYVYNLLACIGVLIAQGYHLIEIEKAIQAVQPVRGRLETVDNPENYTVLLDYAHTPDALKNVIEAIKEFAQGKIITVFGCGGDRDRKKRPLMGQVAESLSDVVIVTSDNPRTEDPSEIIKDILEGISNPDRVNVCEDRRQAIYKALALMKREDVVLIAGKGHEAYQIIGTEKFHFDDQEVVQDFFMKGNSKC